MTLMTLKETAVYLRISTLTAYRMVKDRTLPAVKIGGQWKIIREKLDSVIQQEFGASLGAGPSNFIKKMKSKRMK